MWPFRRRAKALGAAVTAIPSAPAYPLPPVVPARRTPEAAPVAEAESLAPVAEPPAVELPPAPRVELGFRDGSVAALSPDSAQAKALSEIADVLTRKD
jgi:hypothetical protein